MPSLPSRTHNTWAVTEERSSDPHTRMTAQQLFPSLGLCEVCPRRQLRWHSPLFMIYHPSRRLLAVERRAFHANMYDDGQPRLQRAAVANFSWWESILSTVAMSGPISHRISLRLVLNLVYPKVSLRLSRIRTDLLCGLRVIVTVSAGIISCTKRGSWHSTILRIHYLLHLVLSGAILHRTILHDNTTLRQSFAENITQIKESPDWKRWSSLKFPKDFICTLPRANCELYGTFLMWDHLATIFRSIIAESIS